MKLRVFFLVFLTLICLCGCRKQEEKAPPITQGFVCDANIKYGDMSIKAHITRPNSGICRIEITEPAVLNGMVLDWDGKKLNITYLGLWFDFDSKEFPDTGFAQALVNAFQQASLPDGLKFEKKDGCIVFSGQSDSGSFSITVDKDGSLKSLSVPSLKLNVDFKNFTFR